MGSLLSGLQGQGGGPERGPLRQFFPSEAVEIASHHNRPRIVVQSDPSSLDQNGGLTFRSNRAAESPVFDIVKSSAGIVLNRVTGDIELYRYLLYTGQYRDNYHLHPADLFLHNQPSL